MTIGAKNSKRSRSKEAPEVINQQPDNVNQGFDVILNTETQKTINEAAVYVGTSEVELMELFAERLGDIVWIWEMIPSEHEPLLDEFKLVVQAPKSVINLDHQPDKTLPQMAMELPLEFSSQTAEPFAINEKPSSIALVEGQAQDLAATQQQEKEAIELEELIYVSDADAKRQLANSVANNSWQVFRRQKAANDIRAILEIAQENLNNADKATITRLDETAQKLGLTCHEALQEQINKARQSFFKQQQNRSTRWSNRANCSTDSNS